MIPQSSMCSRHENTYRQHNFKYMKTTYFAGVDRKPLYSKTPFLFARIAQSYTYNCMEHRHIEPPVRTVAMRECF